MRRLEDKDWWSELIAEKDQFSLRELAEKFGATPGAINAALKRNGITRTPAPPGPRRRRGRPPAPANPAKKRRRGGAPRGPRKSTVQKILPFKDQLGITADREIARQVGVSIQTVASYRKSLGITARRGRGAAPVEVAATESAKKNPGPGRSAIAPFADQLGAVPDAEIAALAGVSVNAVRNYRNRRGIKLLRRSTKAAKVAKKTPKASRPGRPSKKATRKAASRQAWRVQLAGSSVIVVAKDLVGAARKAQGAGAVIGLELLGAVLA